MVEHAYVVHHIPGRVRVHIAGIKGDPEACKSIGDMALSIPGIQRIQTNVLTGSIVVHYDRHHPHIDQCLAGALEQLDALFAFLEPLSGDMNQCAGTAADQANNLPDEIPGLDKLGDAVHQTGPHIRQLTRGSLDLVTALPVLLAGGSYLLIRNLGDIATSPLFLRGLVAMSLRSLISSQGTAADTAAAD